MHELNARSKYRQNKPPHKPLNCNENKRADNSTSENESGFLSELNIPFLRDMRIDSDIALILGLVLILTTEKADKLLLLALLYILI